jgi:hypothetical protein
MKPASFESLASTVWVKRSDYRRTPVAMVRDLIPVLA